MLGGHPDEVPLTVQERKAIQALKRVAKIWPKSLWLFSASGTLNVMRYNADGTSPTCTNGSADQAYAVDTISIANDGGDW